jgi:hypothetical protein
MHNGHGVRHKVRNDAGEVTQVGVDDTSGLRHNFLFLFNNSCVGSRGDIPAQAADGRHRTRLA